MLVSGRLLQPFLGREVYVAVVCGGFLVDLGSMDDVFDAAFAITHLCDGGLSGGDEEEAVGRPPTEASLVAGSAVCAQQKGTQPTSFGPPQKNIYLQRSA